MRLLTAFALLLLSTPVFAQENYEIQVYSAPTMTKGMTMFELHSNFTANGEQNSVKGVRPSWHAVHETLEITHGITDNFELGFYLFTNYTSHYGYKVIGTHLRPRICAPASWKLPVGLSLSAEIGFQSMNYSADTWSLELRPIIDKTIGKLYVALNPVLAFSLKGANVQHVPAFTPNIKISLAPTSQFSLGVEYYGDLGALNHFEPGPQQKPCTVCRGGFVYRSALGNQFRPGMGINHTHRWIGIEINCGKKDTVEKPERFKAGKRGNRHIKTYAIPWTGMAYV